MTKSTDNFFMSQITQAELDRIIKLHHLYISGKNGGSRAVIKFQNLSGLSFRNKDLSHADFTGSCFIGTDLSHGNFSSATFFACDMRRANLEHASFVRSSFRGSFFSFSPLSFSSFLR